MGEEKNNVRHISLIGWDHLFLATTPSYGHPSSREEGTTLGATPACILSAPTGLTR